MKCTNCGQCKDCRQDLRDYSDNELSLLVFNDEGLYNMRHKRDFIEFINEYFIYTDDQLEVLKADLEDDRKELDNEDN